jgi:uncharacterized membrane protein YgdD (TMEM256/DUF423 family)
MSGGSNMLLALGALLGGLGVAAGAFGAHALKAVLPAEMQAVFETAVRYQMYHALALLIIGGARWGPPDGQSLVQTAGWCFVAGVLLFSGSLYVLALSGIRWLGAVTPLGGAAFLIGWGLLAWAALKGSAQ